MSRNNVLNWMTHGHCGGRMDSRDSWKLVHFVSEIRVSLGSYLARLSGQEDTAADLIRNP